MFFFKQGSWKSMHVRNQAMRFEGLIVGYGYFVPTLHMIQRRRESKGYESI